MIIFSAEDIPLPHFKRRTVTAWIRRVAAKYGKSVGDVSYLFVSDERMREVNKTYLSHDYYTDIITFDNSKGKQISGDIFLAPDTIKSNAKEYDSPYDEELRRVIIHGILHLCGLNDKSTDEQEQMTAAENEALYLLWRG